ncbi:GA module-containing protein [Halomonas denitrificans]|uniref:GA module-containing protein n=1 Tax=Halomonas denitrificans TaxID=370769 RepID=UPI001CD500C8|nr:GA module-containing protein [Halomonas denitrificans]MCA0973387.1 GA module-containing protein [Halomonas denitrificans]
MGNVYWIPPKTDAEKLEDARQSAMRRINSAYEAELASIRSEYPDSEQMTWDKQEREARAYLADSGTATPLLDAMATGRGMGKDELATRIIAKADAWMQASGLATGKRQALEDQVNAAETVQAVETISWE